MGRNPKINQSKLMKESLAIPQKIEAEQAVLGSIIDDNDLLKKIENIVKPETFFKTAHQKIFTAISNLSRKDHPIDEVTVGDALSSIGSLEEAGGYAYIAELIECVPSSMNIVYYAKIIEEEYILRELIKETSDIGREARNQEVNVNQLLIRAQQNILKIAESKTTENLVHIKDVIADSYNRLEKLQEEGVSAGIPTGFIDLDKLISGLIAPDLIVIAARPSMGKSTIALNIIENIYTKTDTKGAVAIFSREMSNIQNVNRMLSSQAKVNNTRIKTGNLKDEDWEKLSKADTILATTPIYLDEKTSGIDQIEHEMRALNRKHEHGLALAVIDYMQLVKGNKEWREQEIAEISRRLKSACKDLNIPIIAISQLNRSIENRSDKHPELSDLRESGAIEQDADIIIFIYRDEVYNEDSKDKGIAEIWIKKHRNGPTGMIKLRFRGKYTRFDNLSQAEYGR